MDSIFFMNCILQSKFKGITLLLWYDLTGNVKDMILIKKGLKKSPSG